MQHAGIPDLFLHFTAKKEGKEWRKKCKDLRARQKELGNVIKEEKRLRKVRAQIEEGLETGEKAVIHVLTDQDMLYHPMSLAESPLLNTEIFDFVEENAQFLTSFVPLRIVLFGVPEGERETVSALFRQQYRVNMERQLWEQRFNSLKMLYMILIGIVFILLYLFLAYNQDDSLFLEILSVIGSFAMWEAANCFFLERMEIKKKLYDTAQLLTAEVTFEDGV